MEARELLDRLDGATRGEREAIWVSAKVELSRDQIQEAIDDDRPCVAWLLLRFDAGPPGVPLPDPRRALQAVLSQTGTPSDAYSVVFSGVPLSPDAPVHVVLVNCVATALVGRAAWLARWLAIRAGLAGIAVGDTKYTFLYFDQFLRGGDPQSELGLLGAFAPLREHPDLLVSPWVRRAIVDWWPKLGVPLVPRLPMPPIPDDEDPIALSKRLEALGAHPIASLVTSLVQSIQRERMVAVPEDDPIIREIERCALAGEPPPDLSALPPWFVDWARSVGREGRHRVASLAGRLLHEHGCKEGNLVGMLILPSARRADLPILRTCFDNPRLLGLFEDLAECCANLPDEIADALIAVTVPRHVRQAEALGRLEGDLSAVAAVSGVPGGPVEAALAMVRGIARDSRTEQAIARPHWEAFRDQFRSAWRRLGDPREATGDGVERAAGSIELPPLDQALMELSQDEALPPGERLVQALALLRGLEGSSLARVWVPILQYDAAKAIWDLSALGCFELRVRLLDQLISRPAHGYSTAKLHLWRGSTLRVLSTGERTADERFLGDLLQAVALAHEGAELETLADALSELGKSLAGVTRGGLEPSLVPVVAQVERAIRSALDLPLEPLRRATVLQAAAHLRRIDDEVGALDLLREAAEILPLAEPRRAEIEAEIVQHLARLDLLEEAIARGRTALDRVTERSSDTVIGMLHITLGQALLRGGAPLEEARQQMEAGLERVRGTDLRNETVARLGLLRLGGHSGDEELTHRQIDRLEALWERLPLVSKVEFAVLASDAAAGRRDHDGALSWLERVRPLAQGSVWEGTLRLHRVLLSLSVGETDGVDEALQGALAAGCDGPRWARIAAAAFNHGERLSASTLMRVAEVARERHAPSVEAQMNLLLGHGAVAVAMLRSALAEGVAGDERLQCLRLLLRAESQAPPEDYAQKCDELEALLERGPAGPFVRIDLAEALRVSGHDDVDRLDRGLRHAEFSFPELAEQGQAVLAERVIARCLSDLVRLSSVAARSDLISRTERLLQISSVPAVEIGELRYVTAHNLLEAGPLCHPDVTVLAEALLTLAMSDLGDDPRLAAVQARLAWIRAKQDGGPGEWRPPVGQVPGPFDSCPTWLVAWILGRKANAPASEVLAGLVEVQLALRHRPDAADQVCANLVRSSRALGRAERGSILSIVLQEVRGELGQAEGWPELETALRSLRRRQRDAATRAIEEALRAARGEAPKQPSTKASASKIKREEQAQMVFHEAVRLIHEVHRDPRHPDARGRIIRARSLLTKAVEFARSRKLPNYPDFLISLGNAWKEPPGEDLERALRCYARARRCDLHEQQLAKLDKVEADALLLRGGENDLRRAAPQLERSIRNRTGTERAAAQISLANVLRSHPDLDPEQRIIRAVEAHLAATRSAPGLVEDTLEILLPLIGRWQRQRPNDKRPVAMLAELAERYPHRRAEIERPVALPSDEIVHRRVRLMEHPAGRVYLRYAARLLTEKVADGAPLRAIRRFGPEAVAELSAQLERERLVGDPGALERALSELGEPELADPARPGILLARLRLVAALCREGRCDPALVREASDLALGSVRMIEDPLVRVSLTGEIARVWAPAGRHSVPLRDFALAASIAREAHQIEQDIGGMNPDIVELLARALRHSPEGELGTNLRESRRLYTRLVDWARSEGAPGLLANSLHCLAEVESQLGEGDRLARLKAGVKLLEEAVQVAESPFSRAWYKSSLAWWRTQVAVLLHGDAASATLQSALVGFDEVDLSKLDSHERELHEHNRTVAEAALAHLVEGRQACVAIWRRRMGEIEDRGPDSGSALVWHNLANALLAEGHGASHELREGLELCRRAVAVRTLTANPRHHWETSYSAGAALAAALHPRTGCSSDELPGTVGNCWREARVWLQGAVSAGQVLGRGEELALAGLGLAALVASAPDVQDALDVADEAWAAVGQAVGALLASSDFRAAQASTSLEVAIGLAYRLAKEEGVARTDRLAFALDGERAERVMRWVLRSQGVSRLPLAARLGRPDGAPMSVWMDWIAALERGDPEALLDPLAKLRAAEPNFLCTEPDLTPTWRWLEDRPGSVAVSIHAAHPVYLAVLLSVDAGNGRRVQVLGLPVSAPSVTASELQRVMRRALQHGEQAWNTHAEVVEWAHVQLTRPIERFLERRPSAVLWCPTGFLRAVSPQVLWEGLPVASSTSLLLADLGFAPARPRSTLVVLADPADGTALDLGEHGRATEAGLVREASKRGAVSRLGSVGARHGRELWGESPNVIPRPASSTEILEHARDHDLIVLIAHGEASTPETAAIHCLDKSGTPERLDVAALGRSPGRFTGATVLLLSCETGRIGAGLHEPGGIAGALVSAGARAVVAPLWPVRLDLAQQVVVGVMEGLRQGKDPWETLAVLETDTETGGPAVGPAAPHQEQRKRQRQDRFSARLQRLAFVTWVG